jgi:hypothetical protein
MALSTTADLNSLYNQIIEDSLMVLRETNLMAQLVANMNSTGYATRTVGIFSTTTATKVAEGVDFTAGTKLSKSVKATFTPEEAMAQFILTDRMVATDDVDAIVAAARNELGATMAAVVDTDLLAKFSSFTASKGTAGNPLTIAIASAAVSKLRNSKVMGRLSAVLHPYQWHDLWVLLNQPSANQAFLGDVANEAMRENFVDRWLGLYWYISANISVDASDDAIGAVFAQDALVLDMREQFSIRTERDESLRATEYNAHMGYATGVLRNEAGVKITSDATEPA